MIAMALCGALLLVGLVAGARWGSVPFVPPSPERGEPAAETAKRFAWYGALALFGGVIAGLTVIGAGGRLVMRLLAVTAGDPAQGRITEADEIVGRITLGGTISFVLFNGIFGGVTTSALYLAVRRYLPPGRLGGAAFGLGLLVVMGTTIDPLRDDNPDFDIVGPGWLAVVAFSALALAYGLVLAAVLGRLSHWLPLLSKERRVLLRWAGPMALATVAFSLTAVLVVVCLLAVGATRWRPLGDALRSPRWTLGGRVVLSAVTLAALPNALTTVAGIAGS